MSSQLTPSATLLLNSYISLNKKQISERVHPYILLAMGARCQEYCCCSRVAVRRIYDYLYECYVPLCMVCYQRFLREHTSHMIEVRQPMLNWIDHTTTIAQDSPRYDCSWCLSQEDASQSVVLASHDGHKIPHSTCSKCVIMIKIRKYTQHFMLTREMLKKTTITDLHHRCLIMCVRVFIS